MTERWLILVPLRNKEPLPEAVAETVIEGPFDVRPLAWHPSEGNSHAGFVCEIDAAKRRDFRVAVVNYDATPHYMRETPEKTLAEVGLVLA